MVNYLVDMEMGMAVARDRGDHNHREQQLHVSPQMTTENVRSLKLTTPHNAKVVGCKTVNTNNLIRNLAHNLPLGLSHNGSWAPIH